MDFSWNKEQKRLFSEVESFARAELSRDLVEADREGSFNRGGWEAMGRFGLPGLPVPREYGGLGCDPLTTVGCLERLGYACADNGLLFSLHAHLWTVVVPLLTLGTREQKENGCPDCAGAAALGAMQ
jgi:alkylation response protein AidB-like acyl-CoA dehydrogenase